MHKTYLGIEKMIKKHLMQSPCRSKAKESGRSMVEMLGTLSVMGLLSIAGVAGYTNAINKHKANEIVHAASLRAMVISTQLQQNSFATSTQIASALATFDHQSVSGATFGTEVLNPDGSAWTTGQTQFSFEITTNIEKKLCQAIYKQVQANSSIRKVFSGNSEITAPDKCAKSAPMRFVFNRDMAHTDSVLSSGSGSGSGGGLGGGSGNSTLLSPCPSGQYRDENAHCVMDTHCLDPNEFWNSQMESCQTCPTSGTAVSMGTSFFGPDSCRKCTNGVLGDDPETSTLYCLSCESGVSCGSTCCGTNQICGHQNNTLSCVNKCESDSDCTSPKVCLGGLCVSNTNDCTSNKDCNEGSETGDYYCNLDTDLASSLIEPVAGKCEAVHYDTTSVGNHKYRTDQTTGGISWWSAENFCKALGTTMISFEDICDGNRSDAIEPLFTIDEVYCNTPGSNLGVVNYGHGNTYLPSTGSTAYWMKDMLTSTYSFLVYASSGMEYSLRNTFAFTTNGANALCK